MGALENERLEFARRVVEEGDLLDAGWKPEKGTGGRVRGWVIVWVVVWMAVCVGMWGEIEACAWRGMLAARMGGDDRA